MASQGTKKADRQELGDPYLELCRRFPLRPLRTEADLDGALAVIDALVDRGRLSADEADYLDVLGDLVEKYERAHHPIPDASDVEVVRFLIESNERTQADVAEATGITESTISAILAGKRKLNRDHIEALSRVFQISPAVFFPVPEESRA